MKMNKVQRLEALEQKRKEQSVPVRKIDMFYGAECENLYRTDDKRCVLEDYYK